MADPVSTWASDRKETIKELRQLGKIMHEQTLNTRIVRAISRETSVAAGFGAAICYCAAYFTLGLSLVPAVTLTGVSIAGGATSLGAKLANHLIEQGYLQKVQKALDKDRESLDKVKKALDKAKETEEGNEVGVKIGENIPGVVEDATFDGSTLLESDNIVHSMVKFGQTVRFTGKVFVMVALPPDVSSFVKELIDLYEGNVSGAALQVLELADELEKELEKIMADA